MASQNDFRIVIDLDDSLVKKKIKAIENRIKDMKLKIDIDLIEKTKKSNEQKKSKVRVIEEDEHIARRKKEIMYAEMFDKLERKAYKQREQEYTDLMRQSDEKYKAEQVALRKTLDEEKKRLEYREAYYKAEQEELKKMDKMYADMFDKIRKEELKLELDKKNRFKTEEKMAEKEARKRESKEYQERKKLEDVEKAMLTTANRRTAVQSKINMLVLQEVKAGLSLESAKKKVSKLSHDNLTLESKLLNKTRQRNTSLQGIGRTLMNQVAMYVGISEILEKVGIGVEYIKEMDKSITTIKMVNAEFAKMPGDNLIQGFEDVAQRIGKTSQEVARMSEALARQGLEMDDIHIRTEMFTKIAAVLGEDADSVTNHMTAMINAFDLDTEGMSAAADVITKLGAVAATSGSEIFTGMQKAAAGANEAGVSLDELARYITIISETTREPAEAIGNSLFISDLV